MVPVEQVPGYLRFVARFQAKMQIFAHYWVLIVDTADSADPILGLVAVG